MSILVMAAPSTTLLGLDANYARLASPSWAEFDRLRSKKSIIVRQPAFRCIGTDKERELRRRKRQWQHLHDAMDKVLDQVLKDINQLAKQPKDAAIKVATVAPVASTTSYATPAPATIPSTQERVSASAPPSSAGYFSSRSPTLCSEPIELPKDSPLLQGKELFDLTAVNESFSRSPSPPQELGKMGMKRLCVESETSAEPKVETDLACGLRLLHRKTPAVQALVRRNTEWRHRLRLSSSSSLSSPSSQ